MKKRFASISEAGVPSVGLSYTGGRQMSPASAIRTMAFRLGMLHVGPVGFGDTQA